MAWSTKKVNKYDLGVNTLKGRIVSQERIDFIEANAPKEIVERNIAYSEMADTIEEVANRSSAHADAIEVTRSLLSDHDYPLGLRLFDNDYKETLFEIYETIPNITFEFDILLEVINDIVITEDLFTFCMMKNNSGCGSIIITPVAIWDDEKRLHPIIYTQIIPDWLVEEDDNTYIIVDGVSMAEARRKMISAGFVENPGLAATLRANNEIKTKYSIM